MKAEKVPATAYRVKMMPIVAAHIKDRPAVRLKIDFALKKRDRVFLVEWIGGPTGRADLCTVEAVEEGAVVLSRNWCWRQGKLDDDLSGLSVTLQPDVIPSLGAEAIE